MDDLSVSFINEAHELLESLEEALLKLETHPDDQEQINTAFRVMHSLKGTGAMFGFEELSAFTHEMESLYDLVRSGRRKVDKNLIDFTFQSIDLIRQLLENPGQPETKTMKRQLLEELAAKFKGPDKAGTQASPPEKNTSRQKALRTWHIRFEPHTTILQNGTRPLYLLDELAEAGKMMAFLHTEKLPEFSRLMVENVYVWWDILLVTEKDENFLKDVFIFVEDESLISIKKAGNGDLLSLPGAEAEMKKLDSEKEVTAEKLQQFTKALPARQKTPADKKPRAGHPVKPKGTESNKKKKPGPAPGPGEKGKTVAAIQKKGEPTEGPAALHETVRVSSAKLDELLDIISEVVTTQARLLHYSQNHKGPELESIAEAYEKLSRQLRENALDMRLIPIYTILIRFKRLVRDLSARLEKDILLKTSGTETELDKSMIEKLYDPLMHIIRNSIDHGIEPAEERAKAGKPPQGLIRIDTSYSGANVIIRITDDGRGMDREQLKKTALEKGLIAPGTEMTDKEILGLIFQPGFTTSQKVSKVSGRGVGMDVVKKNIEELRGSIEVETEKGTGTTITLSLPLTLSIIDGLLVYVGKNRYIFPVNHVKRIFPLTREEIQQTIHQVISKENKQIPFVDLVAEFGEKPENEKELYLLVTEYGKKEMGFVIHSIVGKYQAVIKPLSRIAQKQEIFSGASILGDGEIALVIDTNKTINKFINHE